MAIVKNIAAWVIIVVAGSALIYLAGQSDTVRSALLLVTLGYLIVGVYMISKALVKLNEIQEEYQGIAELLRNVIALMQKSNVSKEELAELERRWAHIESTINK